MFDALVLLVSWGQLGRDAAAAFVGGAYSVLQPRDENMVWDGWQGAVARLGLAELAPLVKAAIEEDFWVPAGLLEYRDFEADLRYAADHPDAPWPDAREASPLEPVEVELAGWTFGASDGEWEPPDEDLGLGPYDSLFTENRPATNPYRSVGRNDPCPCGSGKKYKKCCLLKESPLTWRGGIG
jgi:hypothetical protein